jgi:hypothetical protein
MRRLLRGLLRRVFILSKQINVKAFVSNSLANKLLKLIHAENIEPG